MFTLIEKLNAPYMLAVDLDGVVFDFDRGIYELTGKYPHQFPKKKEMWNAVSRYMHAGNEFFGQLPLMSDAMHLWEAIKHHNPFFLTATGHILPEFVAQQKKGAVRREFGNIHTITVAKSADKQQYVEPNRVSILIDDREKSIEPWIAAGGVGILHKNAATTIRQLNDLIESVV